MLMRNPMDVLTTRFGQDQQAGMFGGQGNAPQGAPQMIQRNPTPTQGMGFSQAPPRQVGGIGGMQPMQAPAPFQAPLPLGGGATPPMGAQMPYEAPPAFNPQQTMLGGGIHQQAAPPSNAMGGNFAPPPQIPRQPVYGPGANASHGRAWGTPFQGRTING